MNDDPRREAVLRALKIQIGWCESLASPFTARVLTGLMEDIAGGGAGAALVDHWIGDPVAGALPLRLAGALHALVLGDRAPDLAACYPPRIEAGPDRLQRSLSGVLERHRGFIETFLKSPPQTNEVGRSAVLLGGFLEIARVTGLPFRLMEIGASAGLNTLRDRYHYRLDGQEWGDPQSPVHLAPEWQGPLPPLDAPLRIASRRACDIAPIDLDDPGQSLRLRAYIWPDQRERMTRLEGAIALARTLGQKVERADAATWIDAQIARSEPGCASVLYHSIMWQYMPGETQAAVAAAVAKAGERADHAAPLAWLRFEPVRPEKPPELRLTLWPGANERCLAVAHPHGSRVTWGGA